MTGVACAWCRREVPAEHARPVPAAAAWMAALALAFLHGGLWVRETLARGFCPRCRARIVPALIAGSLAVFAAAGAAAVHWLRRGLGRV